MDSKEFEKKVKELIDDLKSVCATYGLGNDGNEFKIITQVFLYKFLNDKFAHEVKQLEPALANDDNWQETLSNYKKDDYEMLLMQLSEGTALIQPNHFIFLWYIEHMVILIVLCFILKKLFFHGLKI